MGLNMICDTADGRFSACLNQHCFLSPKLYGYTKDIPYSYSFLQELNKNGHLWSGGHDEGSEYWKYYFKEYFRFEGVNGVPSIIMPEKDFKKFMELYLEDLKLHNKEDKEFSRIMKLLMDEPGDKQIKWV